MNEKNSFVLYTDIGQHIALLDDAECGKLFRAVISYADSGAVPNGLGAATQMAFSFIRAQIDRDAEKWADVREKRRNAGRAGAAVTNGKRAANAANADFAEQKAANPAVPVPVPVPVPVTVTVTGTERENKEKKSADKPRRAQFEPPGEPAVMEYFRQQSSTAGEASAFYDYYTANGWTQGKGKAIKDWQAAARGWIRRAGQYQKPARQAGSIADKYADL